MKSLIFITTALMGLLVMGTAQPVTTNGLVASFNFDGNATIDLRYGVSSDKSGDFPETWNVGFGMEPLGQSRFVRASSQRISLQQGEAVDVNRAVYRQLIGANPPIEVYSLLILNYRAILNEEWEYTTTEKAFEGQAEVLLGLKLALSTGTHYGWLRMTRPVVDRHTPFEIAGHAYHPVPGEPIPAGELPPLPPLQTVVDAEGFTFSWDPRWGELVLETATSLAPPVHWEPVVQSAGGPVTLPVEDEAQRFYRLRQP